MSDILIIEIPSQNIRKGHDQDKYQLSLKILYLEVQRYKVLS